MDMDFTRLKESGQYQRQREELRVAELDLIDHVERVAALRRRLPADTVVDDYELLDAPSGDRVRLSGLFSAPDRALVLYHFMYGKAQRAAGAAPAMHDVDRRVQRGGAPPHAEHRLCRGRRRRTRRPQRPRGIARLAQSAPAQRRDTTFKYDLGSEEADGTQTEWISVFTRSGDGTVRHVYSKGAQMADDRRERGIDLLSPVWHLLDLTPHGRGDWYPSLNY
jgi:predicted dithiol-disulfide oxidoreductase (DUF899 family)